MTKNLHFSLIQIFGTTGETFVRQRVGKELKQNTKQ